MRAFFVNPSPGQHCGAAYNSASARSTPHKMITIPSFRRFSRLTAARLLIIATTALLAACSAQVEDTRPGQPVKTRQQAFKEMLRSFEPMGVMLRENRYDADKFAAMAATLMSKRDAPWAHFGPDTNYPPTKATPKVWSDAEHFEKERLAFIAATDKFKAAVDSRDKASIEVAYKAVYDSCQSCHKPFKER